MSLNDVVVHGIPSAKTIIKEGDILSIDLCTCKYGFIGDSAYTFAVGNISEEAAKLLKTTKEALYKGIEMAVAGNRVGDISNAVQTYCEARGYSCVREMVGHGIGKSMHEDPQVPTFAKVLGVGEYKPQDKVRGNLGIFNACEEITAEQWKGLGFVPFDDPKLGSAKDYPPYYSCFYRNGESDKEFQEMLVAESTFDLLEGQMKHMTPLDHIQVNKPENFYLLDAPNAQEKQCSVGVVTSRGRLTLNYGYKSKTESISKQEACQRAVDKMQAILALKYEPPAEKSTETAKEKAAPESAPKSQSPSDAPAGSNAPDVSEAPKSPEATPEPAPSTSGA